MSADLLAAFGDVHDSKLNPQHPEEVKQDGVTSNHQLEGVDSSWQPWPSQPLQRPREAEHDNLWETDQGGNDVLFDADNLDSDDFGDFEQADNGDNASGQTVSQRQQDLSTNLDLLGLNDLNANPTVHAQSLQQSFEPTPGQSPTGAQRTQRPLKDDEPSTLIDADNDDDWGGFEDGDDLGSVHPTSYKSPQKVPAKSFVNKCTASNAIKSDKKPTSSTSTRGKTLSSQKLNALQDDDFDTWDDFEDSSSNTGNASKPRTASEVHKPSNPPNNTTNAATRDRPTNIPPPAVLLSLIPKAFSLLASQTQQLDTSDSIGFSILQAYIVCARIIAGRVHRWKRDTILAQSMRIGAAGRSGGMKLTSVDKGESRREDQAAEEAIASWSKYAHRLNPVLVKSKVPKPPMSLSPNLVVRTATGADVLIANHPCPVCGLKRNERVNGIDINVSDTFGEFWVEHWGHKNCYDFWYCYSELLDQRS